MDTDRLTDAIIRDIRQLNVMYLVTARDLCRRAPEQAPVLLGIEHSVVSKLAEMPVANLVKAAEAPGVLTFAGRFTTTFWRDLLDAANSGRDSEIEAAGNHATMMAAAKA